MAKITKEDIVKMSIQELNKALEEAKKVKVVELMKLKSRQTHEQKIYKANKKLVAQISTELTKRRAQEESNTTSNEN